MSQRESVARPQPSQPSSNEKRGGIRWWLALPLVAGALVTVSAGLAIRYMFITTHQPQELSLFFSDTPHLKAWLSSVALALACFQLLTAARIYRLLRFPPKGRFYHVVHRWSGRLAILLTLPVAFYCLFLVGVTPIDLRVSIHMALGAIVYGVFVGKVFLVRMRGFPGWALPVAGSLLFTVLLGLWLTSAYWLFATYGVRL
ncbi:MAG TPA: DUF6529 family protein [Ktedonobacterales bacterium]